MDYPTQEIPEKNNRPIVVGIAIGAAVLALVILAFAIWRRQTMTAAPAIPAAPVNEPVANADSPAANALPVQRLIDNPKIEAGMDRPLTEEEKVFYRYQPDEDVWVKTSAPTDGSDPQASFYVKNPPPPTREPSTEHID